MGKMLPLALRGFVSSVTAFNTVSVVPRTVVIRVPSVRMEAPAPEATEAAAESEAPPAPPLPEYSEALPFLTRRASLGPKGALVGDIGFDPLGFTEIFPMAWLREAELKHCRVCMLAVVGFIFTDFYTLPGFEYSTLEAHDACVAQGGMSQILLWVGLLEILNAISIDQMLRGSGREAGDYGFDPLGMISDPAKKEEMQMKELANGRLAMFAFGGAVTQAVLTGNTFPWLYSDGPALL